MVAANLSADSQPKSVGMVWGLAATRRSVCIHQMNRVNSRNDYVMHDDSTVNIVSNIIIIILLLYPSMGSAQQEISTLPILSCEHHTLYHYSHAVLQSPDHVSGMTCHRPCVHHPVGTLSFKAHSRQHCFVQPFRRTHTRNQSRAYSVLNKQNCTQFHSRIYGWRSFAVSGQCVWNDLPSTLHASPGTLWQFQSTLKTILFRSVYRT